MSPRASSTRTPTRRSAPKSPSVQKKNVKSPEKKISVQRRAKAKTSTKKLSTIFEKKASPSKKMTPVKHVTPTTHARPSRMSSILKTIGLQCIIAGSAAVILIMMGMIERDVFTTGSGRAMNVVSPATIGLEFEGRLALSCVVAEKDENGYISITNTSAKDIHISLPSSWSRLEVMNASLEETKGELPVFGFTRYKLPKFASLRFAVPELPSDFLFDARGTGVAAVTVKTVHLDDLKTTSQTVLVQKQTLVRIGE